MTRASTSRSACPICGTATTRCRPEGRAFLACPDCGTRFRRVLLTVEATKGWEQDYYAQPTTVAIYAGRGHDVFGQIEAMLAAYAGSRGDLLDVGCGRGEFLDIARARGWRPHGVEPSPSALAAARATLGEATDLRQGDFLELELPGGYDALTMVDVLRHCPEPRAMLERAHALLRQGGCLMLRENNARWTRRRRLEREPDQSLASEPVQEWPPGALEGMLERVGFTAVRVMPSPVYLASSLDSRPRRLLKRSYTLAAAAVHGVAGLIITRRTVALARKA